MRIKLLLTLIIIMPTLYVVAQSEANDKIYYSRYQGVVDSNLQVTANFIRLFDNISGNYYFSNINKDKNSIAGNTISVNGEINENQAILKEYGSSNSTLSGSMDQQSFTGTWNLPADNKVSFNIIESYPAGTLPFDIHYLHSEDLLVPDSIKSPVAEIELTLIYPLANSNAPIIDSVKHIIADGFFGDSFYDSNPDSMLTNFELEYYTNYRNQNYGRSNNGASFNWQKTVNMSIIHNSDFMLCIEYLKYAYSGGAHGMTNISYSNINLSNGLIINYDNIFKLGVEDTLSSILTKQLYQDKKIPADISLVDAGYFVDRIKANHNLFINNNGIGFLYNSYEIAPYSYGQTSIFIEFDKIRELLVEDSPIFRLCNK